jgi:hypothetical protein
VGITEIVTAPRSPWQNFYIERVIGSIRRECLDHIVVFNEPICAASGWGSRFDEDRKQGPFADANDQSRASGEEEIGIPIAETIGGMQRNRRGFDVKPFEEFARTTNGQHVRSGILPTPFHQRAPGAHAGRRAHAFM